MNLFGKDFGASSGGDPRTDRWLFYFLVFVAFILFSYFVRDYATGLSGPAPLGWDLRMDCAAADAYAGGLDPYYVKNLKDGSKLFYPYLPVTLTVIKPICAKGIYARHYRKIFFACALISALLLSAFSFSGHRRRDAYLKILFVFGGLNGFIWAFRCGNPALFDGVLMAVSLFLFYRGFSLKERKTPGRGADWYYGSGAALMGFVLSFKLIFFPLVAGFYFFPLPRARKITLMLIAIGCFALPFLASYLFYHDLFSSWLLSTLGRIPDQQSVASEAYNPSFYSMGGALADGIGIHHKHLATYLFYGLSIALVPGSLGFLVAQFVRQETGKSFLAKLDRFLLDNPRFAMRLATLAMLALFMGAPRLKEYSFFELAQFAAMLVVDLPPGELALVFFVTIAAPLLARDAQLSWQTRLFPLFDQTFAALFCYGALLLDLWPAFLRLRKSVG
jgi:hypothetical protein